MIITSAAPEEQADSSQNIQNICTLNGSKSALYKNWFGVRWVKEAAQQILASLDFAVQRLIVSNANHETNIQQNFSLSQEFTEVEKKTNLKPFLWGLA